VKPLSVTIAMFSINRRVGGFALALALTVPGAGLAQPAAAADPAGAMQNLVVPGGTADLARAAGIDPALPRARVMLTAIRVLHELTEGVDAAADTRRRRVAEYLKQLDPKAPGPGATAGDAVPLPLPAAAWAKVPDVSPDRKGSLLTLILGNRYAALAYYGLCAMDGQTRAFLAASPAALTAVFEPKRAAVLAMYGRSLRVRGTSIDVPGGQPAVALWEDLVGVPVAQPAAFIGEVLGKDKGRLALFYDTIAHLDGPRQAFTLGVRFEDAARRGQRFRAFYDAMEPGLAGWDPVLRGRRFRALYDAMAPGLAGWDPVLRPFARVPFDATQLLWAMRVSPSGRMAGPSHRLLWQRAFESQGLPTAPAAELEGLTESDALDAASLVGLVGIANTTVRRERMETVLVVQHAFGAVRASELADVLLVTRAFPLYRALIVTLDRMGLTRPATYSAAVRRADRVTHGSDRQKSTTAVAVFQGALALIERARFSRVLDPAQAEALVTSLCDVSLSDGGEYLGGVASWIERDFLGAVGTQPDDPDAPDARREGREADDRVLAAMTGATVRPSKTERPVPIVEWEGLAYRVDPASGDLRRSIAVRQRQAGTPLDVSLALARLATTVRASVTGTGIPACIRAADASAAAFAAARPVGASPGATRVSAEKLLDRARDGLRQLTDPPNPNALLRIATLLRQASDASLGQALMSLSYATLLGHADTTALLGGDPALRHDLGLFDTQPGQASLNPWRLPEDTRDPVQGWHLAGSLLGLDTALGRFSLRRVGSDHMPPPPRLRETDRQAFTDLVVLMNPSDQTDAGRDSILRALARGRARVASIADSPLLAADVGRQGDLDEWRLQALVWAAASEPEAVPGFFSLSDLVRLGADATAIDPSWHPFGASAWALECSLALRYETRADWTTLSGRKGTGLVPALVTDLTLAVLESLSRSALPASLSRGVLSAATQDMLDELRLNHDDDWMAIITQARGLLRDRVEDYIASLTADGPLVPVRKAQHDASRD
jgi:hypothetical protein